MIRNGSELRCHSLGLGGGDGQVATSEFLSARFAGAATIALRVCVFLRVGSLVGLLILLGINGARAGPWPEPEGHGLLITSLGFLQAQNYAGIQNPAYGNGTFRRFEAASYVEYGLTDRITLVAAGGGQVRQLDTGSALLSTSGIGDIELSVRPTVWLQGDWAVATQGIVKIPTRYNPSTNPALGNGQVDLEPRLLVGRSFMLGAWPAFASTEAGYRFRLNGPSDQLRIGGTLGIHPAERWLLLLESYNIIGMQNAAPGGTDFDLATVVASAVYEITPRWAVQVGGFSEIASRNYNRGNAAFFAIWLRF